MNRIELILDSNQQLIDLLLECLEEITKIATVQKNVAIGEVMKRYVDEFKELRESFVQFLEDSKNE